MEIVVALEAFALCIVAFPAFMECAGSVEIELSTHSLVGLFVQHSTICSSSTQFELTSLFESIGFEDTMISP